ncbi:50S ribosomal protein L4 [Candidatus Uhrbacteria bacterium]|nr:50S ribosomal protein L4 [Candidatus Uhrbacteria bacterium]
MASVELYSEQGEAKGTLALDDRLFGVTVTPALVHQAVVTQAANGRASIAHTKTRGEVQGTTKKPWKQKGTGRARHGSRRSPIWIGGGITFGPRSERNFSLKMNKRARQKALAMVLSDKVANGRVVAIEQLTLTEGKTKSLMSLLKKLPLTGRKTLVVSEPDNKSVARAARNLRGVETIPANALNVVDLLRVDQIVVTVPAVAVMTHLFKRI